MTTKIVQTGMDAWRPEPGEQTESITCPHARPGCGKTHTEGRYSHYYIRKLPKPAGTTLAVVMLNPSCPDMSNSMFGRVRNLADEEGCINRIAFLNLFAYRGRTLAGDEEAAIRDHAVRNHVVATEVLAGADEVVLAWGLSIAKSSLKAVRAEEIAWYHETLAQIAAPAFAFGGRTLHPRRWTLGSAGTYRSGLAVIG